LRQEEEELAAERAEAIEEAKQRVRKATMEGDKRGKDQGLSKLNPP